MKSILFLLSLLIFNHLTMPCAHSFGGDVGNGGGIAEQNFAFAYGSLERYYNLCLGSPSCGLNDFETTVIRSIRDSLAVERRTRAPLVFLSHSTRPEFFNLDGNVRIARTGSYIGSVIYVNTDLIYTTEADQRTTPADVPTAVAVLTHELAHHQGAQDHTALDVLGAKIRSFLQTRSQQITWNNVTLHSFETSTFAQIVLEVNYDFVGAPGSTVDLTEQVHRAFQCPFENSHLVGSRVYNIHWGAPQYGPAGAYSINMPVAGFVDLKCETPAGLRQANGFEFNITLNFAADQGTGQLAFRNDPVHATIDWTHSFRLMVDGDIDGMPLHGFTEVLRERYSVRVIRGNSMAVFSITSVSNGEVQAQIFHRNRSGRWDYAAETLTGFAVERGRPFNLRPLPTEAQRSHLRVSLTRLMPDTLPHL